MVVSCDLPTAIEPRQTRHVMATKRMLVQYWRLDRAILKLALFALRPCPGTCCEFVGAVNSSVRNQRDLNRRSTGRKSPRLGVNKEFMRLRGVILRSHRSFEHSVIHFGVRLFKISHTVRQTCTIRSQHIESYTVRARAWGR